MNKVTIEPFLTPPPAHKTVFTPTCLHSNRNHIPQASRLRFPKSKNKESEEPFKFDDAFYFREFNKNHENELETCQKNQRGKKCLSQIMTVKIME